MWMDNYSDWQPVFRVVERGARGSRLHIHFIATNYIEHEVVLEAWRSATGEKGNVNFSYIPSSRTSRIFGYVLKYILKDKSKYSWMGSFYKAGAGVVVPKVCEHGNRWVFVDDNEKWGVCDEQFYNR